MCLRSSPTLFKKKTKQNSLTFGICWTFYEISAGITNLKQMFASWFSSNENKINEKNNSFIVDTRIFCNLSKTVTL